MEDILYSELFKVPSEKFLKHLKSDINQKVLFRESLEKGKQHF